MLCQLYHELVPGIFDILTSSVGVLLGAGAALCIYFRQKEYELVKERYLDGAIDVVASEIERTFGVYRHNATRCLQIMKAFRDEEESFDLKELSIGFQSLEMALHQVSHHRIGDLVGSQLIWHVYQFALAFVANADSMITKEFPEVIRMKLKEGRVDADPKIIFKKAYDDIERLDKESERFAHLIRVLHELSRMLETEKLTFKSLGRFRNRPRVRAILGELQREFANDLADDGV